MLFNSEAGKCFAVENREQSRWFPAFVGMTIGGENREQESLELTQAATQTARLRGLFVVLLL